MKGLSCPKCRFALTKSEKMQRECPNCSVIFEKYKSVQAARRKREDELNRADKFSNSLTGKEKMYVQWDIRWNYIKEMLHKLGVYEFVIKLIGLIALFITVSGIVYIVTSFYGSMITAHQAMKKIKYQHQLVIGMKVGRYISQMFQLGTVRHIKINLQQRQIGFLRVHL